MFMLKIRNLVIITIIVFMVACTSEKQAESDEIAASPETEISPLQALNDSINQDTLNAGLLNRRAKYYLDQQQVDKAMRDLNKALRLDKENVDIYLTLAEAYFGMGKPESITATLIKATQIDDQDARPLIKLAELNLLQQKLNIALGYTDRALQLGVYNPEAYYVRGMIFLSREDTVSAMKNFLIARDQNENFFEPLYQIGTIYTAQRNPLAVDFLKDAIKKHPRSIVARVQLALYLQDNEAVDEAIQHYDTLLQMQAQNSKLLFNLGYVYLIYKEEYEKAIGYFDAALAIDPNYIDALYNKGRTFEQMGRLANAREIYQNVLQKKSNYPLAVEGLNRIDRLK